MTPKRKPAVSQPDTTEQQLRYDLNFDEADLSANREGHLSPGQIGWLRIKQEDYGNNLRAFAGFWVMLIPLALVLTWGKGASPVMLWIILSPLAVLPLYFNWQLYQRVRAEVIEGKVASVQSRITITPVTIGALLIGFSLQVGDQRFRINQDLWQGFKNGEPYRIYYSPRTRLLLSAEWLNSPFED